MNVSKYSYAQTEILMAARKLLIHDYDKLNLLYYYLRDQIEIKETVHTPQPASVCQEEAVKQVLLFHQKEVT